MSMKMLDADSLSVQLGKTIPEIFVVIAKNDIAGLPAQTIAEILGVTAEEVVQTQTDADYRDVRLLLGADQARMAVQTDSSWDAIENFALTGLVKRVPHEKDTETLLKIAAVANKAQRRTIQKDQVLDPSQGAARVPLKLTRRIMERINSDGSREREETQQISLMNGTAKNPTFEEIDSLLGVSARPRTAEKLRTPAVDFGLDDLVFGGK